MSVSYFVFYKGQAEDPEAFLEYYKDKHVPILKTFPGIQAVHVFTATGWADPAGVHAAGFSLIAQMTFVDSDALSKALASGERARARQDFLRFPRFEGVVFHQAMQTSV